MAMTQAEALGIELASEREGRPYDLADHFIACAKLGRYLTVATNDRFVITDDFRKGEIISEASAVAAIYSRDPLVGIAALVPMAGSVESLTHKQRDKYERLFHLIAEQTLSPEVKHSAESLIEGRFRAAEIRAIEAELGNRVTPARRRYRQFLGVVRRLLDGQVAASSFIEEFRAFTREVAGKLDFGIYSFALDTIFRSMRIPVTVKKLLTLEILRFPPLIRRELVSNVLAYPGQTRDLIRFVENLLAQHLEPEQVIQIDLLKDLKLRRFSMEALSALAAKPSLAELH
jgi:hypothetical protein